MYQELPALEWSFFFESLAQQMHRNFFEYLWFKEKAC